MSQLDLGPSIAQQVSRQKQRDGIPSLLQQISARDPNYVPMGDTAGSNANGFAFGSPSPYIPKPMDNLEKNSAWLKLKQMTDYGQAIQEAPMNIEQLLEKLNGKQSQ